MMSLEVNVHGAQTSILRELLFRPQAGYAELQKPTGLTSDHFNFHIARLVELKLVEKVARGEYRLTPRGKEYANKLDTDQNTIERQPKCAVLLAVEKTIRGESHFLFQERLKHPYYGFWGLLSGKIRWGETILETAARELMEEAGIEADWEYKGVYHEQARQADDQELLEDKIFHIVRGTNPRGKLADFEGGHNDWLTRTEARSKDKIYPSFDIELDIALGDHKIVEQLVVYDAGKF
jgi:ADP-ribose pyrophosphatase YjhB (NUDIX family)